jgi:hypothetical protein
MPYVYTTTTTADDVIFNTAVSAEILNEARAALVAADKVLRYDLPVPGPNAITVPRFQSITVEALSQGVAQEAAAVSTDGVTITASKVGSLIDVTDETSDSGVPTFSARLLERAGVALADKLDADVLALATGFSGNVVGTSGVSLTLADFIRAAYLLDAANAPKNVVQEGALGRTPSALQGFMAFLHPVQHLHLSNTLSQSSASWLSDPSAAQVVYQDGSAPAGFKGSLLGVPVFLSTNCPLSDANANRNGMMISAAAIGLAVRYLARVEQDRDIKVRSNQMALTSSYGLAELVDTYGVRIRSSATA